MSTAIKIYHQIKNIKNKTTFKKTNSKINKHLFPLNAHNIDDKERSMYTAWNNKGTVAMNRRYMKSYDDGESVHG